jgi:hypothetical protein
VGADVAGVRVGASDGAGVAEALITGGVEAVVLVAGCGWPLLPEHAAAIKTRVRAERDRRKWIRHECLILFFLHLARSTAKAGIGNIAFIARAGCHARD